MIIAPVSLVNLEYEIKGKVWKRCKEHATDALEVCSDLYKKRGSINNQKIWEDIALGKAAESAAYFILREQDASINKPDYNVYKQIKVKHDPDLQSNKWNYHIKSTTWLDNPSWLFSKYDPILRERADKDVALLFVNQYDNVADKVLCVLKFIVHLKHHKPEGIPISSTQAKRKVAFYTDELTKKLGL